MKKYAPYLLIATTIAILFLIFRSCERSPHIPDITTDVKAADKSNLEMKAIKDSIITVTKLKDDTIRQLRAQINATKVQLKEKGDLATRLATQVISRVGPVADDSKCDSLATAVIEYKEIAMDMQGQYDSALVLYASKDSILLSALKRQQELYAELWNSYSNVRNNYNLVSLELRRETRKRKVDRTIVRILGVATLSLGAILLSN